VETIDVIIFGGRHEAAAPVHEPGGLRALQRGGPGIAGQNRRRSPGKPQKSNLKEAAGLMWLCCFLFHKIPIYRCVLRGGGPSGTPVPTKGCGGNGPSGTPVPTFGGVSYLTVGNGLCAVPQAGLPLRILSIDGAIIGLCTKENRTLPGECPLT